MISVTLIGVALISLATPFVFKTWIKMNKWFFALIALLLIPTTIVVWEYFFETPYSYIEENTEINGNQIVIKTEYYHNENKLVRSHSYWKNDKRDSLWTVLSQDGKIISEKLYRNDSLISRKY